MKSSDKDPDQNVREFHARIVDSLQDRIDVIKAEQRQPDAWEAEQISAAFHHVFAKDYRAAHVATARAHAPPDPTQGNRDRTSDTATLDTLEQGLAILRSLQP